MGEQWAFRKKRGRAVWPIILLGIIIVAVAFLYKWVSCIEPNIDRVVKIKAKSITNQYVNEALSEAVTEGLCRELFEITTNVKGEVEFVQTDTERINILITSLMRDVQKKCNSSEPVIIEIPIGTVLGSKILSEWGPEMPLKIKLLSVSSAEYTADFENKGINQTKYRIFAIVKTRVAVLSPFYNEEIEVENNVFVAEAVIVGRVPDSYVVVPENEILETL